MSELKTAPTNQAVSTDNLRKRHCFGYYEIDTFQSHWHNERDMALCLRVYLLYISVLSYLVHYIYCSWLISTIILWVLFILLHNLDIVIIAVIIILASIIVIILLYLLISFTFMYLFFCFFFVLIYSFCLFTDTLTYSLWKEFS